MNGRSRQAEQAPKQIPHAAPLNYLESMRPWSIHSRGDCGRDRLAAPGEEHDAKSNQIKTVDVGITCEFCSISDCEVRKAPPLRLEKQIFNENMKKSIQKIRKEIL